MRRVAIDLHIHSALSPCASSEMTPPAVLMQAERQNVAVVGVVDHSTAGNARAFLEAAPAFAVRVFVGLEMESAEGVHVLALFDNTEAAQDMDALVATHLPAMWNRPEVFGEQCLLDEWGRVLGTDPRLLLAATDLGIEGIVAETRQRDGMAIPAHVDRVANGLLSVLGVVPQGLAAHALELSRNIAPEEARRRWPELAGWPLVCGSDAHCLADIGVGNTTISLELAQAQVGAREWGERLGWEVAGRE